MENIESQQFRDNLAKSIRSTPKRERKEILEKAKQTPEYWQVRSERIHDRQNEEEIDDGLGVFVKKKTIYHGSSVSGIEKFDKAEEDTVGSGIYFTSEAKDAIGYARRRSRSRKDTTPVIYEASVEKIKLLDLRKSENVKKILIGFRQILVDKLKESNLSWYFEESLRRVIDKINSDEIGPGNLREVAFSTGTMFSNYVKSIGYDGLIAFEGGEGDDIGNHDTYLIFDPDKVKINQEHKII